VKDNGFYEGGRVFRAGAGRPPHHCRAPLRSKAFGFSATPGLALSCLPFRVKQTVVKRQAKRLEAVLCYPRIGFVLPSFQGKTGGPLISWNEVLISWNKVLISWNKVLISWNEVLISWNEVLISWNKVLISWNKVLISWNKVLISWNKIWILNLR
jgi:hypothetical protein